MSTLFSMKMIYWNTTLLCESVESFDLLLFSYDMADI